MFITLSVNTTKKNELKDITGLIIEVIKKNNIVSGTVTIFIPHTTAAVTINENADPDVCLDIINGMNKLIPDNAGFRHNEGNSDAHIKSSLFGPSLTLIIHNGQLLLGTWQGVYFCEFDGPRNRKVYLKIVRDE